MCDCDCVTCDVCGGRGEEGFCGHGTNTHTQSTSHTARTHTCAQSDSHEKDKKIAVVTQLKDERSRNGSYNGTGKNGR